MDPRGALQAEQMRTAQVRVTRLHVGTSGHKVLPGE